MQHAVKGFLYANLLGLGLAIATLVLAEEAVSAAAEEESPHSLTANIGFFGQYVFRGITYTRERPAIQGGFDYAHVSGAYLGVWATNVDKDALYGNTAEIDVYGGFANTFGDTGIGYDVGFLQFYYPDNDKLSGESANTLELNGAVSYEWFTLKYSRAVTDFFGYKGLDKGPGADGKGSSRGSDYLELNFNYTLPWWDVNLVLHAGHQRVKHRSDFNYTDYLIGVNKDFSVGKSTGWNAGVNYTMTTADDNIYVDAGGKHNAKDHVIFFLKRTF